MNSESSRTPEPHILILKLTDKLDLRIGKNVIALSNLSIYYTWKNIRSSYNGDKNGENVPHLEINEVVLVHCNIVNNDYQQASRFIYSK